MSQDSDPLVCLQSMYSLRRWGHDFKITHDKLAKYKIKKKKSRTWAVKQKAMKAFGNIHSKAVDYDKKLNRT